MASTSFFSLALRLVLSLGVVILLMLAAAWVVRRRGGGWLRATRAARLDVLARTPLSRSSNVTVVRCGDRALVLGVTEQSVTMLAEAHLDELDLGPSADRTVLSGSVDDSTDSGTTRKSLIEALRDRTTRRG